MKEKYVMPEMEVVEFEAEDMIVASLPGDNDTPSVDFSLNGASYTVDSSSGFMMFD